MWSVINKSSSSSSSSFSFSFLYKHFIATSAIIACPNALYWINKRTFRQSGDARKKETENELLGNSRDDAKTGIARQLSLTVAIVVVVFFYCKVVVRVIHGRKNCSWHDHDDDDTDDKGWMHKTNTTRNFISSNRRLFVSLIILVCRFNHLLSPRVSCVVIF